MYKFKFNLSDNAVF